MNSLKDCEMPSVMYILLAGGLGKRLWPVSRFLHPKPLFRPDGGRSLLGATIDLISSAEPAPEITALVGVSQEKAFRSHLNAMDTGSARTDLAVEPLSRNTAPAIALGVMRILRELDEEDNEPVFVVSPSDHFIGDKRGFHKTLKTAVAAARQGLIVAIGVEPTRPETGYGYIQKGEALKTAALPGEVFKIKRFAEKPDPQTAEKYVADGFLWNCGIFVFKGRVMMEEIKKLAPEVFSAVRKSLAKEDSSGIPDKNSYSRSPDISIDFAVMEKTNLGAVVPASFEWSDIGSWEAVYNLCEKQKGDNAAIGDVILENSENCLVRGGNRLIVGNGLKDLVIVDEPDAVFVSRLNADAEVKPVVDDLIRRKRIEALRPARLEHGWGFEELTEKGDGFSVKTVCLFEKTEYEPQATEGRIVVLEGEALAVFAEKSASLSAGDLLEIPGGVPLRVKNRGESTLRLLEISFEPEG